MGTYTTVFSWTNTGNMYWKNTTAATSGTAQSSPALSLFGNYWNGSASAPDQWQVYNQINSGTNGASTLSFYHSGTSGSAVVSVPDFLVLAGGAVRTNSVLATNVAASSLTYRKSGRPSSWYIFWWYITDWYTLCKYGICFDR
jgi:hypothetical protein